MNWREYAKCDHPSLWDFFFPERGQSALRAKKICFTCPVRKVCLATAFSLKPHPEGVWGGTTHSERLMMETMGIVSNVLKWSDLPPQRSYTELLPRNYHHYTYSQAHEAVSWPI